MSKFTEGFKNYFILSHMKEVGEIAGIACSLAVIAAMLIGIVAILSLIVG